MKYETIYDLLKDILEQYNIAESDEWVILTLCAEDVKDIAEDMEDYCYEWEDLD